MNDTVHFAEHTVTKKYEGKYRTKRFFAILAFISFFILVLIVMLLIIGAGAVIWYVPLTPTAIFLAKKGVYDRFFNTEYSYTVAGGVFTLTEVNSDRYKKTLTSFRVSEATEILPYSGEYKATVDAIQHTKRIEAVSSMKADDIYAIAHGDELIFVEGISKTVRLFSHYNKNTVMSKTKV